MVSGAPPGKTGKITKRWTRPCKIVWHATNVHYVIKPASPTAKIVEVTSHVGRLRCYTGDITANQILSIQDDIDGDEDATSLKKKMSASSGAAANTRTADRCCLEPGC